MYLFIISIFVQFALFIDKFQGFFVKIVDNRKNTMYNNYMIPGKQHETL